MANFKKKYGEWALITGASSGIGKAFAQQLAKKGLNLVLVARNTQAMDELADNLSREYKISTRVVGADLTTDGAVAALADAVNDLDIGLVVPSAGIDEMGQFLDKNVDDLNRMVKLNVRVPTEIAHVFGQKMSARKRSGIILVASLFGYQGIPNFATYAATKAYILVLGEALNVELRKKKIDVLVLSPGLTDTPFSQNMEIDFSKIPMIAQKPEAVAKTGLRALGGPATVVSGLLNKFYAWENRLLPRHFPVNLFGLLINNAIRVFQKKQNAKAN